MTDLLLEQLSVEQLEELIEDQDDEAGKAALQELLEKRKEMEERLSKASRKGRRSGLPRKPTERHLKASDFFNNDPAKLSRLKKIVEESIDPSSGEPVMSPELIRVAIGAYYDQRKRDDLEKKATGAPVAELPETLDEAVSDTADEASEDSFVPIDEAEETTEMPQNMPWEDDDESDSFPGED